VLRRYETKSVSAFSSDPDEQRKAAIRLGYDDFGAFRDKYLGARAVIHGLYNQHLKNACD
jgi:hypothetical protein